MALNSRDKHEKLKGYLVRFSQPRYWPALFELVRRKAVGPSKRKLHHAYAEAIVWCRSNATDVGAEGGKRLGVELRQLDGFSGAFATDLAAAKARVARSGKSLGGAANLGLIYGLCEQLGAVRVLETGVAAGWSTLAILLSLRQRPGAFLESVDMPYLGRRADDAVGIAVPDDLRSQWRLHRMPDRQALPKILKHGRQFDLVHYDSDKSYHGRSWAYRCIWPHIRQGGFFISDDIQDNMAFAHFAKELRQDAVVLKDPNEEKYAGILKKTTA